MGLLSGMADRMTGAARLAAVTAFMAGTVLTAGAQAAYRLNKDRAALQLRTNALYALAAVPNVGIEIQTGTGLAWQLDYMGAWWNSFARNRFWSSYAFQSEIRYYPGHGAQDTPYFRHHVGVYAQMATFDLEFGGKGILCRNLDGTWGAGASWGYTLPLTERISVDFTVGMGYLSSRYDTYEPRGGGYVRLRTNRLRWFGPTRAEATLVLNLNSRNVFRTNKKDNRVRWENWEW